MKTILKLRFILPIALLWIIGGLHIGWAGSNGKIAGKIVQATTKEPLASVNVIIVGTTMGTITDPQGEYVIPNVPIGLYSVRASIIGFKPVTVTDVRVQVDVTSDVNFSMEETALELGKEIVITAERPLVEKDNTSTRTILESSDVSNRPATELSTVLVTLPSINFENGQMKIRGGTLDQVAVLIDGVRARNPLDQTPYLNVNLSSIQEMEVITGSFNAEYGEAQSGVFNIVTKDGADRYSIYTDVRYTPPGRKHWGAALYDYSTDAPWWENTHARHLQWWRDYPSQWVDPNGIPGSDPRCSWTPEQAYNYYMKTHQPLHDYTNMPGYQVEASVGGPIPSYENLSFFLSGKYHTEPPVIGNSYLDRAKFFSGTGKLSYALGGGKKFVLSGFYGNDKTVWGVDGAADDFYANNFGLQGRYAFYDFPGYPESETDGQSLKFTDALTPSSMFEAKVARAHVYRKNDVLPGDPVGWAANGPTTIDYLRVTDSAGNAVIGANADPMGYNTIGYYSRFEDHNTNWSLSTSYINQINKHWQLKGGIDFEYNTLDHFNESKAFNGMDSNTYHPYQGAGYVQNTLEFGGMIMNVGLRYDFYNPNNAAYTNLFDPLNSPTTPTATFTQLSPRLGVSHPIDEKTVLHFSYGHFFERGPYGDYGELATGGIGSLTTFIDAETREPLVLGNRNLKPSKVVMYEVGVERNIAEEFIVGATAYYKDITNTIHQVLIRGPLVSYVTTINGDYADNRGVEFSLRMRPTNFGWGSLTGYANFSTQIGIDGTSNIPASITTEGETFNPGGDVIQHNEPRLKAGFVYKTPGDVGFLGGALNDIRVAVDFTAVYPNSQILSDYFRFEGQNYMRPADKNTNLKLSKDFLVMGSRLTGYVQIDNLFNDQWLDLGTFYRASLADQEQFVKSGFKDVPSTAANGTLIFDMAKFRNLPRAIYFGATFEL